jgi:hypothetical protein
VVSWEWETWGKIIEREYCFIVRRQRRERECGELGVGDLGKDNCTP